MARSRNIKPNFFKNETLAECSPLARLLFAGLWCLADRVGRLEDRPRRIRAEVLPYDDGNVDGMLNELHQKGFILRYQVGDQRFIQVLSFEKHQNPHCREPSSTIPAPDKHRAGIVPAPVESGGGPADSFNLIPDFLIPHTEKRVCSPSASDPVEVGFPEFWQQYPNKKAKQLALKAWRKLHPNGELLVALMEGLERQKQSADWQREGGRFIPYPASWLAGHRWEDEIFNGGSQTVPLGSLKEQNYTKGISDDGRF